MEKPNFFSILPATVRYNPNLRASSKLLFSEITALTQKEGFSFASNGYYSKVFNVSISSISAWIKELEEENLIRVEFDRKGKQIIRRRIYVNLNSDPAKVFRNLGEGIQKSGGGVFRNLGEGYSEISTDNNTSKSNNTRVNIPEDLETIVNLWNTFAKKHNLSQVTKLTGLRERHLRKRLNEKEWNIFNILEQITKQPFLLGQNKHGWKVSFDFITESQNKYIKILENHYGGNNAQKGATAQQLTDITIKHFPD
jgi:DNA-binding MarR family transcriptional regulator